MPLGQPPAKPGFCLGCFGEGKVKGCNLCGRKKKPKKYSNARRDKITDAPIKTREQHRDEFLSDVSEAIHKKNINETHCKSVDNELRRRGWIKNTGN